MESFALEVLPEVYERYIPQTWTAYLIQAGHTTRALEAQAETGYRHYLVEVDGELAGYFALHERGDGLMELTHLYFHLHFRGQGLGGQVMTFVGREAEKRSVPGVERWVLRENLAAVGFYRKHGYVVVREVMTPIGPDAELEDYIMRKEIGDGR